MFAEIFEESCIADKLTALTFLKTKDADLLNDYRLYRLGAVLRRGPVLRFHPESIKKICGVAVKNECLAVPYLYGLQPRVAFASNSERVVIDFSFDSTERFDRVMSDFCCEALPVTDPEGAYFQRCFEVLDDWFKLIPNKDRLTFFGVRPGGAPVFTPRV